MSVGTVIVRAGASAQPAGQTLQSSIGIATLVANSQIIVTGVSAIWSVGTAIASPDAIIPAIIRQYPNEGATQHYPLEGASQSYPNAGRSQSYPKGN
jgi:hypothetical protein